MSRKPVSCAVLLGALALWGAAPAYAEAPFDVEAGVRVVDTTNTLGSTSDLESSIADLASQQQINLFVVTIDRFENPASSESWAREFAELNNFGANDVLLVVATEDRQAYFVAGSTSVLSSSQQTEIYQNYIYPRLASSDYEGAAQAAVTGISEVTGGSSSSGLGFDTSGATGVLIGGGTLLGVAAIAGGSAWILGKGRQQKGQNRAGGTRPVATGGPGAPTIQQLRLQAGELLVKADDAIAHSLQEVEFARLQYGDKEVAPFVKAIEDAKTHMQRSFQLQKQLDDEIPDTEADQRAWLGEIIARTQDAQKALNEQIQNFTNLRKLEDNAPQTLAALQESIAKAQPLFPVAQRSLDALGRSYSPSAFAAVADNIEEAHTRLAFARESANQAQAHMASNRSAAIVELRAGEEALGQVRGLLEAIQHAEIDLGKMAASLDNALIIADRDVAQAQEMARTGAPNASQLSGAAAGVAAVLSQIRAEKSSGLSDPYLLNQRLHEVRSELDAALGSVRKVHEQEQAARDTLVHTLISAQAQVSSASEYVWARRGGVKSEARTRLREAERNLQEAQRLQHQDPVAALASANDAIRLATDAQTIARSDVSDFNNRNRGYGRGDNFNSAMLGGILLGTLLNGGGGGNHGGSWGGGSWGGGTFGGGFGGGGNWGGGGGAGGNF